MAHRLLFLLLPMLFWLTGCSREPDLAEVPLAVLAGEPVAYDGRQVATQGLVRRFEEPLHYWIEDEALHRVEISPHNVIAPHLGEAVRVEGHFAYSPDTGRRLTLGHATRLADQD